MDGLSSVSVIKKIEKIAEKEKNPLYMIYLIRGLAAIIRDVYARFETGLELDRGLFSQAERTENLSPVEFFLDFLDAAKRGDNPTNKLISEIYKLRFASEFSRNDSPCLANLETSKFISILYAEIFSKTTNLYFERFIHRQHWS